MEKHCTREKMDKCQSTKQKRRKTKRKRASLLSDSSDDDDNQEVFQINNHFYLHSEITRKASCQLQQMILRYLYPSKKRRYPLKDSAIVLHIHSVGGEAGVGLLLYDFLRNLNVHVTTVCDNECSSAACTIFLAGTTRLMAPNAFLMIHQISYGYAGSLKEHEIEVKNTKLMFEQHLKILTDQTKLERADAIKHMSDDSNMSRPTACRLGFCTNKDFPAPQPIYV